MAARYCTILVAAVCLYTGTISEAAECGVTVPSVQRIVGGDSLMDYTYPWFVALLRKNDFSEMSVVCGGAMITDRHVLTAAHCFPSRRESAGSGFRAVLRLYNRCDPSLRGENVGISKVNVSPKYNPTTMEGDIAIITLDRALNSSPICLPQSGSNRRGDSGGSGNVWSLLWNPFKRRRQGNQVLGDATVIGFGSTKVRSRYPCYMQEATVKILSNRECKRTNLPSDFLDVPNTICAGVLAGRIDSCDGDSGGPLMTVSANGRYTIQGITSFGEGCGRRGLPGVYTQVSAYLDWIDSITKQNSGGSSLSGGGDSGSSGSGGSNRPTRPTYSPKPMPQFPFPFSSTWQGIFGSMFNPKRTNAGGDLATPESSILDEDPLAAALPAF